MSYWLPTAEYYDGVGLAHIDGVVAGVGTGGTIMGLTRHLRHSFPHCRFYALEAANSPTLTTGKKCGQHR